VIRSESRDGGRSWAEGKDSRFPNPNSAVEFIKLASGNLLLLYNDSMSRRTPLTAALSVDGDKSWPFRRNIGEDYNESYAYPSAVQTTDGKIHVVYTSQERTVVYHAIFDEEWVKAGKRARRAAVETVSPATSRISR
jgi:predicted neuraminidase